MTVVAPLVTPAATLVVAGAGPSLIDLGEGAPWWAKLLAGVVSLAILSAPFVLPRLTARQPGSPATPTPPVEEASTTVSPQTSTTAAPNEPDPEIALIAETLRGYRDDLRSAQTAMAAAEQRHRDEMAAAERRHQQAMGEVKAMLDERGQTIARLESMIDMLTGRQQYRPPPPQGPYPTTGP